MIMQKRKYIGENHFCRIDDSKYYFDWYKENALDTDIDVHWTFDFCEYMLQFLSMTISKRKKLCPIILKTLIDYILAHGVEFIQPTFIM